MNSGILIRIEGNAAFGTIRVFFDNSEEPLMVAEDTRFGTGYIGFGAFDDSCMIDKIRIVAPYAMDSNTAVFDEKKS